MKKPPFSLTDIQAIAKQYPTPFYLYDERAIRLNARNLLKAFDWADYREFFAVKAAPNPRLMSIFRDEGCGVDCSSLAELTLAEHCAFAGDQITFTSNDTPEEDYRKAIALGATINLDDISDFDFLQNWIPLPEIVSFRYNPGPLRDGNAIIGNPQDAKFGVTREQLFEGYRRAKAAGAKRFGLHTMIVSNELDHRYFVATAEMMFELAVEIYKTLDIKMEFINLGGGLGIPYEPGQKPIDLDKLSAGVKEQYDAIIRKNGLHPLRLITEFGRYMTGPFGYLVTTAIHKKDIYKHYVGLDACMANLMRPGMYGAYHHITVLGKEDAPKDHVYDVTGSLCENNDKFAVDRSLPEIVPGDILVIHDAGAHGHAMGFNYNGKLRSAELLLTELGSTELIRRAETLDDYFSTLEL